MNNPKPANPNMADNFLFEHFATLATAPDGIARLRELILQLAVQGKLGTQDAGDEPASVLLEKIKKEREKLITEGRAKPEKSLEPINHDKTSFDIPKEWRLTKFGDIIQRISNGYSRTQIKDSSGIPLTRIETISHGYIDRTRLGIVQEVSDNDIQYYKLEEGDILFSHINSDKHLGKTAIFREPDLILHGTNLLLIRLFKKQVSIEYIDLFLKYLRSVGYFISIAQHAIHQSSINQTKVKEIVLAIPPLAEQHRIVAKVDRLMALCDELEARQQQERAGCFRLGTATLAGLQNATHPEEFERLWAQVCDAFDLILDCPENVKVLRQTILQLAVQGRLVRQEPGDEPAGKLFEKIQKIKKNSLKVGTIQNDKKFSPLIKEIPPWTIPKEWSWVRLQDIFEITRGGSPRPSGDPQFFGGNIPWITVGELTKDTGKYLNKVSDTLTEAGSERSRFIDIDDLLLTNSGATLGVPKISKIRGCINDGIAKLGDFHNLIDREFAYFFLSQQTSAFRNVNQGMGQPNLNTPILAGWFFPLPPLAEQHRIVAKVDALMALCDELEARLKERAGVQGRLAGAVVKSIGTG